MSMQPFIAITPHERDLGGFSVRRLLPSAARRTVGPFVFFDHMGPADFPPGQGIDVRPHPHIGLATVTYLFEGAIEHRDSLGTVQTITAGDVNWMTAGRGIVHSERSPADLRRSGYRMQGLQTWVALPRAQEQLRAGLRPSSGGEPAGDRDARHRDAPDRRQRVRPDLAGGGGVEHVLHRGRDGSRRQLRAAGRVRGARGLCAVGRRQHQSTAAWALPRWRCSTRPSR